MQRYLFISVFTCLVAACGSKDTVDSSDVNEDKIYGRYSATYDADAAKLSFFAQFRLGGDTGTTIRLKAPSAIEVKATALQLRDGDKNVVNFIGTYYDLEQASPAPEASYLYKWTLTDGATYENTVTMARSVALTAPTTDAKLSRGSDINMAFEGDDVRSDEQAFFYIESDQTTAEGEKATASMMITGGKQTIFAKSLMANFVKGPAYAYVLRKRSEMTQQGHSNAGGRMDAEYRSKRVTVTIMD